MNSCKNDWIEMKSKIKTRFSKLSDSDIEGLKGHLEQLTSKVQKAYEYNKKKAEQVCQEFNDSLK